MSGQGATPKRRGAGGRAAWPTLEAVVDATLAHYIKPHPKHPEVNVCSLCGTTAAGVEHERDCPIGRLHLHRTHAPAPAPADATLLAALAGLLAEVAPDDEACLLCGARGDPRCCAQVRAARDALGGNPLAPPPDLAPVRALLAAIDEALPPVGRGASITIPRESYDRVRELAAAPALRALVGEGADAQEVKP